MAGEIPHRFLTPPAVLPPPIFAALPAELVETLSRSLADRLASLPLAGENLMFGFVRGGPAPATPLAGAPQTSGPPP